MSILATKKDIITVEAYIALADMGYQASLLYEEGKDASEYVEKGLKTIRILEALQMDQFLEDPEIEDLLNCLLEVAGIHEFPAHPAIAPIEVPAIYTNPSSIPGPAGPQGPAGPSGALDIDILNDPAYDNMKITQVPDGTGYDYFLAYDPYAAPTVTLNITNGTVKEQGSLVTVNFTASYNEGRETITQPDDTTFLLPVGFPEVWDTNPKAFADANVSANKTYQVQVDDGTTQVTKSASVSFVYPFFWGHSPDTVPGDTVGSQVLNLYTDSGIEKKVEAQGTKSPLFNATNEYFYFAYPDTYADLTKIEDNNGFDVTSAFTKVLDDVTSTGLDSNYTQGYKIYRTNDPTTINSKTYKFFF